MKKRTITADRSMSLEEAPLGTRLPLDEAMEQCIQACLDCHHVCLETVRHRLRRQGREAAGTAHIRMLLDCAELCQTTADFICSESAFHGRLCALCADLLELCAERCEAFGDDPQMRACAEACRRCADFCRSLAGRRAGIRRLVFELDRLLLYGPPCGHEPITGTEHQRSRSSQCDGLH